MIDINNKVITKQTITVQSQVVGYVMQVFIFFTNIFWIEYANVAKPTPYPHEQRGGRIAVY